MQQISSNPSASRHGFALVATLALMILLAILAVGLLSLSAVTLSSSGQGDAQAEARANARMALMIAIGELQKQMGPYQRVSANGAILSESDVKHPHWMGVWDSWVAGDPADAPVNGDYPSSASHHQTIGAQPDESMRPDYANKDKYFRSWLVSLPEADRGEILSAKDITFAAASENPTQSSDAVRLVGSGSLGSAGTPGDFVDAPLVDVKSTAGLRTGRYGWWVGDESQKARIMDDSYAAEDSLTGAEKIFRSQAPASTGTTIVKGLENITDDAQLATLPSLGTLDLADGATGFPSRTNFHHISAFSRGLLADVREGGLKRDLSTILEQPIRLQDNSQEFMLYEFDDPRFPYLNNPNDDRRANSRVPIQDLAAYYQLYDHQPAFANGRKEGVQYSSAALPNALQIKVPDHDGGAKDRQRLIREYTSLYRRPVVTKVQFLVGVTAEPITQAERDWVQGVVDGTVPYNESWRKNIEPIRSGDTHKLRLGIQPMVTLWNPGNLPLVMESTQILRYNNPPFGLKWRKHRDGGQAFESRWFNLGYANNIGNGTSNGQGTGFCLLRLKFAQGSERIVFEPGEVKVFSIPTSAAANLTEDGNVLQLSTEGTNLNTVNGWDPFGVFLMRNSAPVGHYHIDSPDVFAFKDDQNAQCMVFGPGDKITYSIESDNETVTVRADGRSASSEISGAGFSLYMLDEGYQLNWRDAIDSLRHDIMVSRHGSGTNENKASLRQFHGELMLPGFPGETKIDFDNETNAIPGSQIIASGDADEIIAVLDFSLSIGCESPSAAAGGYGGARRITSRPFLHSAASAMPFISESDKTSLYDYGWDWQVNKINAVEDSILQAKPGTGNGYYGGGYTVELGTTHVVQSEVPVLPPISIASLSHAHLGGFSLAKAIPVGENPDTDNFWFKSSQVSNPTGVAFQRVTASGQNGLAPHVAQAIGNSYAHPNIPANKAFVTKRRTFDLDEGAKEVPFVDHSYLANKALWDEFFFSSISPQPAKVELYGGASRTAKEVAQAFFFDGEPLPNRRIVPYSDGLDQPALADLFEDAGLFEDGLADEIASHLMVEGAFNVNSTSVEAWKTLLSSLRGKPLAYLDGGKEPAEAKPAGTAVSQTGLPNAVPVTSDRISTPNQPQEQWMGSRDLTDGEIDALGNAIVGQVKLRGPFLSLSEFINRRLDGSDTDRSLKGALQAALDDEDVTINANFRNPARTLDAEVAGIGFAFPDAAKGPAAYGSAAYVDQADVLRGLAAQLSPRGDTFVIRTYGDSMDASGNVVARAWCEAVVQRVPGYLDPVDEPHAKQADLTSESNKRHGRRFQIVGFRWLNADEI